MHPALIGPPKEGLLRRFLFKDLARKTENGHCDMSIIIKKYGI